MSSRQPAVGCAFGGTGRLTPNEADVGDAAANGVSEANAVSEQTKPHTQAPHAAYLRRYMKHMF